jgi:GntR family transcriptional regulator
VPIYRQIIDQIKYQITVGVLNTGDKLPSVRGLAQRLAVNQNTILKVYNELCRENILKIERGHGTYVSCTSQSLSSNKRQEMVADTLRPAVIQAIQLKLSKDQVHELLDLEYQKIQSEKSTR